MDRNKKRYLRGILFRHLDGIALCGTISALNFQGITTFLQNNPTFSIKDILSKFECNAGYLNISLRLLSSQGWLEQNIIEDGDNIEYTKTKKGSKSLSLAHHYDAFTKLFPILINIDRHLYSPNPQSTLRDFKVLINNLNSFNAKYSNPDTPEWEMGRHLEGILLGPILVSLGMSEFFLEYIDTKRGIENIDFGDNMPLLKSIVDYFHTLGWVEYSDDKRNFTDEGFFFLKRSTAYGVTVSYLPTFLQVSKLLFGNPNILWKRNLDGLETHVNRRMNVWGSGGAHSLYFKKIDEIIANIFNQPLDDQPIGIADMGCGDGTLLKHLYNVVKNNTIRGASFDKYPLKIIGADFNKAARLASSITLKDAGIDYSILHGDISNPTDYAKSLKDQFRLELKQMLNVRSFLDHNRIYSPPNKDFHDKPCNSTGAFAFRGRWIPNKELKQNLIEHFSAWTDYVSKYGLLILELHTISPQLTASHLGQTVATAYDSTHGYSDQYIIEADIMLEAANEAGLICDPLYQARFPSDKIATISINLFRSIN